jgi:hypothetical protein
VCRDQVGEPSGMHCIVHPVSDGIDGHAHQRPDQRRVIGDLSSFNKATLHSWQPNVH